MLPTVVLAADHWDGPGPWWPLLPLLWIAVLVAVLLSSRRRCGRGRQTGSSSGQARLAERYAAGEIDEAEYRERLAVLRSVGAPEPRS
jgi:putative membrane protein